MVSDDKEQWNTIFGRDVTTQSMDCGFAESKMNGKNICTWLCAQAILYIMKGLFRFFMQLAKFLGISAWNHSTSVQVRPLTFPYRKILPPQKASTLKWLIYRHSKLSETLLSIFDYYYLVQHQKRTRKLQKSVALLPDHHTKQLLWNCETAGVFMNLLRPRQAMVP